MMPWPTKQGGGGGRERSRGSCGRSRQVICFVSLLEQSLPDSERGESQVGCSSEVDEDAACRVGSYNRYEP